MLSQKSQEYIQELREAIEAGAESIAINLINCPDEGRTVKRMIEMLVEAGYAPDNMGPQREYRKPQCKFRDAEIGCRDCVSNSKHICSKADANRYIEIPIYSEEQNERGTYDLIGYRKEYVD